MGLENDLASCGWFSIHTLLAGLLGCVSG